MLRLAALLAGVAAAFAAAPDKCPAGYTAFQGRCFKYNANPLTWVRSKRAPKHLAVRQVNATQSFYYTQAASQAQCQLEDADLAGFADQDDFDFLWALCVGNECWTGANDITSEG